jgi:hypothetical protein
MKFGFLPFFRRFHSTNGNVGSRNFVPPTAELSADCVLQNGWLRAEVSEFSLPPECMALFRFGHAQENAFASLVPLAFGQIAIRLRRLDFSAPIAFDDFYMRSISWFYRSANCRLFSGL